MPNISGSILFSLDRTISSINTLTPVSLVAITLYNQSTQIGASILSDSNGNFEFASVPSGNYILVETYGVTNANQSPYNFSNAKIIPQPIPKDPDVSAISFPLPSGTNTIDSMTPNTLNLSVNSIDLLNQHFIDGPSIYTPVTILNQISTGANLITLANNGTFGNNPPGSPINLSPSSNPYPGLATGFGYQQYSSGTPNDGNISIANIQTLSTFGSWWNLTDHTTGNEQGSFLVVNGDNPGSSIFTQIVNVDPSTYYAFSGWIANQGKQLGLAPPLFSVKVTGISGGVSNVIYYQVSNQIPVSVAVPNWVQLGAIFNSENYDSVSVDFISEGPAASGNDYAIDDISLRKVIIESDIAATAKSAINITNPGSNSANLSDILQYNIPIVNTSQQSDMVDIIISDTISQGTTYIPGSLVGGTLISTTISNPLLISTPTLSKGQSTTVSFKVSVNNNISTPVITNTALINYGIKITENISPAPNSTSTNTVRIPIQVSKLDMNKSVSQNNPRPSDMVTYTISLYNEGTTTTNNIFFIDTIPQGLSFQSGSFYINNQNIPTVSLANNAIGVAIPNISPNNSTTIQFNAIVSTIAQGKITNTALSYYNYISGNKTSDTISVSSSSSIVVQSIPQGNISLIKDSSKDTLISCEETVYTVSIVNNTSANLTNVIFFDSLPKGMEYVPYSFNVNSSNYNLKCFTNSISIGTIPANSTTYVNLKAKLLHVCNDTILGNQACISYNSPFISQSTITCSNISYINAINPCNRAYLIGESEVCPDVISQNGVVTYYIDIYNEGGVCANNISVINNIPLGLTFIPGSFYINNQNITSITVVNGALSINIPRISENRYVKLSFEAIVNKVPNSTIINTANISYNYITDYQVSDTINTSTSSTLTISTIPNYNIKVIKSSQLDCIRVGNINTYEISICNNSAETLKNVIFYESLPNNLCYVPGSFTVENKNCDIRCIDPGVLIGDIKPTCKICIKLKAKLICDGEFSNNQAYIVYNTVNNQIPNVIYSNITSTTISNNCGCNYF